MVKEPSTDTVKVATETWVATALLHREHPERPDFTVTEIIERVREENITGTLRRGISVHAYQHCVANFKRETGQYRMLYATGKNTRRLYRSGDEAHPTRNGKITPKAEEIPPRYRYLLDWYHKEYAGQPESDWLGGIAEMIAAGKDIFAGEDPDAYVQRLREQWN